MKTTLAVILCFLSLYGQERIQKTGTVSGVVLDETGKPVEGASVHVAELGPFYGHRILQIHETDSKGRFSIDDLKWGSYAVLVGKEEAGYPDQKIAFYSNLAVPTVTLNPEFPTADVKVKLPPKAGRIEITTVVDASTGKKIETATMTLHRLGTPFLITASAGSILVPSDTEISIEVEAPGYQRWPAVDEKDSNRLRLKPLEIRKLQVKLQPVAEPVGRVPQPLPKP